MQIVKQIGSALQHGLIALAEDVGKACGVIKRKRKFDAQSLTQTLVLGYLQNPNAKDEDLAQIAAWCGVSVTPQAIAQRFTWPLVEFLQCLLERIIRQGVCSQEVAIPLLQRFNGVYVQDSSTINLPDALAERWPGCGGNGSSAAVKVQTRVNLSNGSLSCIRLEPGKCPDQGSTLQRDDLPAGSLRIADLGYFCMTTLARLAAVGVYWISRIQCSTSVFARDGSPLPLLRWLRQNAGRGPVEISILLGKDQRHPCRLIAFPSPPEVVARRRQSLLHDAKRKGRTPSRDRLDWCQWTVFVTNVEAERLTIPEVVVLYRARWQIELLFKLWKSHGLVDEITSKEPARQAAEVFARLLAAIVQHWLLICSTWRYADRSLVKAVRAIRRFATILVSALRRQDLLLEQLEIFSNSLQRTARINQRRRKPNTYQLLLEPALLDYRF